MDTYGIPRGVRVGHVHLMVSDVDRALGFYRELLGLKITGYFPEAPPHLIVFLAADDSHHDLALNAITSRGGGPPPPGHTGLFHVAFQYPTRDTLAAAVRRIHGHGIPFRDTRGELLAWPMVAFDHLTCTSFYVKDPDGTRVELFCDQPRSEWRRTADGLLRMGNQLCDVLSVLPEVGSAEN